MPRNIVKRGTVKLQYIIEWEELKGLFVKAVEEGEDSIGLNRRINIRQAKECLLEWSYPKKWSGNVTAKDMAKFIKEGYPVFAQAIEEAEISPLRKRRHLRYNDFEGEYQHDLFLSGDSNYFQDFPKRLRNPGARFNINQAFSAATNGKTVVEYLRWNLKSLMALESSGIDCAVTVHSAYESLFQSGKDCTVIIPVKKENEASDYKAWSALFSPGGYRILTFFSMIIAADRLDEDISSLFGYPIGKSEYCVEFNTDFRDITIWNPVKGFSQQEFNPNRMTATLMDKMELARDEFLEVG